MSCTSELMCVSYINSHTAPGKGAAYDQVYRTDPWHRYLWSREQEVLARILHSFYGGRPVHLLDFACGTGRIASVLEDKVQTSIGVDVSDSMLEVARQKLRRTELIKANIISEKPFAGRKFNLITAFRFFVNAEPDLRVAALQALEPLLADDGYLVINNHQNRYSPWFILGLLYMRLKKTGQVNVMSILECKKLLAEVGMEINQVFPVGMLHVPKINLPHRVYRFADAVADRCSWLSTYSESAVLVTRRNK